jgi:hypothetical protein
LLILDALSLALWHQLRSELAAVCDLALLRWPVHGADLLALNLLHHIVALNHLRSATRQASCSIYG